MVDEKLCDFKTTKRFFDGERKLMASNCECGFGAPTTHPPHFHYFFTVVWWWVTQRLANSCKQRNPRLKTIEAFSLDMPSWSAHALHASFIVNQIIFLGVRGRTDDKDDLIGRNCPQFCARVIGWIVKWSLIIAHVERSPTTTRSTHLNDEKGDALPYNRWAFEKTYITL